MPEEERAAQDLVRLDDYRWLVPRTWRRGMRTEGLIYASESMIPAILADRAPEQVANVACLPGIVGRSLAMPDIHWGYGFAIGGVAATDTEGGVISPGGVGYDINCGVRLLLTGLTEKEVRAKLPELVDGFFAAVPAGVGGQGGVRLSRSELRRVLREGARWAVRQNLGSAEDIAACEDGGMIGGAEPEAVSDRAVSRGLNQLGTLGSGNHFLEVDVVDELYDPTRAGVFGLQDGMVVIGVHVGSRGLGHQVCADSLEVMQRATAKYGLDIPDRQLACAPVKSPEGEKYLGAMAAAANYAWANRQVISNAVRKVVRLHFGSAAGALPLLYDVAHNIAKIETHTVENVVRRLCVHRKGATRAFPPAHPDVPSRYRAVGQPVLVPGDMGRYSYVLAGTAAAMDLSFGSACHGAGRLMSRTAAKRATSGDQVRRELAERGILVKGHSRAGLAEEAPAAYKDAGEVVDVVHGAGLATKVARLRPIGVIKG